MRNGKQGFLRGIWPLLAAVMLVAGGSLARSDARLTAQQAAKLPVIELEEKPAFPLPKHLESNDIASGAMPFAQLFESGAKLFHAPFNGLDGVGMKRKLDGTPLNRFSVGPAGGGQPVTVGSQSCSNCHNQPVDGGYGPSHTRVFFDAAGKGVAPFNPRDTISLFGNGVIQLLAQEMTEQLWAARDTAAQEAKGKPGTPVRRELRANGVDFGVVIATAKPGADVTFDLSQVRGVSPDLVVRPFGWKGNVPTIRDFSVVAASLGMGMQAEEFVWRQGEKANPDADGDGVSRELSVGDITAMTIFNAALPVPTEIGRLAELRLAAPADSAAKARIENGRQLFGKIGCATCHVPEMRLAKTVFEEPTLGGRENYLDRFLASKDTNYDAKRPARFDLVKDSQEPRVEPSPAGGAIVRLYGDLKRHDMGRLLADPGTPIPAFQATLAPLQHEGKVSVISQSEFLTPELWGVGSTGPWLHDDRAGTIAEAIVLHGEDSPPPPGQPGRSEAQEARDNYMKLAPNEQAAIVTFLKSLVTVAKEANQPR